VLVSRGCRIGRLGALRFNHFPLATGDRKDVRLVARLGAVTAALVLASGWLATPVSVAAQWSRPSKVAGVKLLAAVSCVSRRFCMAVGGRQAAAYRSGGWRRPQRIDSHAGINDGLVTVSCVSARFCAAGDGVGDVFLYNGRRWSAPTLVNAAQLSCAARVFCGAVVGNGDALFYDGSGWSAPRPIPGAAQPQMISCPAVGLCMALDAITNRAYRLSQGRWVHAGSIRASFPPGGSEPNVASAVSCSGPHFCAALDDFGEAFTWAGQRWSRPHTFDTSLLAGIDAVSCPSRTACMAVDYNGLATGWNGTSWSPARQIDAGRAYLNDVSCAAARFCIAVDMRARALIYR
jgi:hypothetical protein